MTDQSVQVQSRLKACKTQGKQDSRQARPKRLHFGLQTARNRYFASYVFSELHCVLNTILSIIAIASIRGSLELLRL